MNVHFILPCISLIFAVTGIIWPQYPLIAVAVILLAVSALVP